MELLILPMPLSIKFGLLMDEIEQRLNLLCDGGSAPEGIGTPENHQDAAGGKYEPLRYHVDPAGYSTEDHYIEATESKLGRGLGYDEWEDARTQWAKEWA